jgi:Fic/DOC family
VPGPVWDLDDLGDTTRLAHNSTQLVRDFRRRARDRSIPSVDDALGWHSRIYASCRVPVAGYVGHFRGDPSVPDLVDYEVGGGPLRPDGLPEKVGVPSAQVAAEVAKVLAGGAGALAHLDSLLPAGRRPSTADEIAAVVLLTAHLHGEWVRVHPFANGNGRTARAWAAFVALRYGLPVFVTVKPRPGDLAYARAGRDSMGHPPDFVGDHSTAVAVFGHLLTLSLLH